MYPPSSPTETSTQSVSTEQRPSYRFSGLFRGTSVMASRISYSSQQVRNPFDNSSQPSLPPLDMSHLNTSAPGQRSPTSTRSLIDPSATPASSARSFSMATWDHSSEISPVSARAYLLSPRVESLIEPYTRRKGVRKVRPGPRWRPRHSRGRVFFPAMRRSGMRTKIFHCILSGSLLAITLIVFLALSVSGIVAGQGFHIVLILFLLIFTVIFCHSLIRLLMIAFALRDRNRSKRMPGRGEIFAHPDEPIRVVLAADEEMAFDRDRDDGEKELAPPPPAYGLWRGSTRIDPDLLRWQRAEPCPSLAPPLEEPGIDANRPPSYISDYGREFGYASTPRTVTSDN